MLAKRRATEDGEGGGREGGEGGLGGAWKQTPTLCIWELKHFQIFWIGLAALSNDQIRVKCSVLW